MGGGLHIVICDSNQTRRDELAAALVARGYAASTTGCLEDDWQRLRRQKPNLLLIDEHCVARAGQNLAATLATMAPARPPVIVITASSASSPTRNLPLVQQLGVVRMMHEPVSAAELLLHVELLVARYATTQDLPAVDLAAGNAASGRDARADDARARLAALRSGYADKVRIRTGEIAAALKGVRDGDADADLDTARNLAHRLRGTAGSYGFVDVSRHAGRIEDAVRGLIDTSVDAVEAWREIDEALAQLQAEKQCRQARPTEASPERGPAGSSSQNRDAAPVVPTLLLVSHDAAFEQQLVREGRRSLIRVLTAGTPNHALAQARQCTVDAVMVDIDAGQSDVVVHLPRNLRAIAGLAALPIAFVSEDGALRSRIAATHAGAAHFLTKPVNDYDLTNVVRQLFGGSASEEVRVLLVDDDRAFADMVAQLLEEEHFRVSVLTDAGNIVETLDKVRPGVLLFDLMLPWVSGLDLCKIVRANPMWQMLPILVITGLASEDARIAAFEAGADDYLLKPIVKQELLARIRLRVEHARLVRERSTRDALTGMMTRQAFVEAFANRLSEVKRDDGMLSLAIVDIDKFKLINDEHGHLAGDRVLAAFGHVLASRFRECDLRGRWGGEEFVMGLRDINAQGAGELLRRLQMELQKLAFIGDTGRRFHISFSAGIGVYPEDGLALEELIQAADRRLYMAKRAGRSRIQLADNESPVATQLAESPDLSA